MKNRNIGINLVYLYPYIFLCALYKSGSKIAVNHQEPLNRLLKFLSGIQKLFPKVSKAKRLSKNYY